MNLENMTKIYARGDSRIQLKVIPGHFVTSQSHITHYLDLTTMKSRTAEAQNIAHELAAIMKYLLMLIPLSVWTDWK